ncbi:hypothetical protein SAY87_028884 [Trapa incisa]|uniref:Pectate lyase N-terminal domain-containing protein n=1 Tax=Trapa incisa TaxID=236973 RepID=A0AAN7KVP7_9MYRT|nr:hypothetical protein SAY87_028884 [Trapa incisa]
MASVGKGYALILFSVFFALIIMGSMAHVAVFDEYWQKRAEEAKKTVREAYHPNPEEVTNHLNIHVHDQGNRFIAPPLINPKANAQQVTKREYSPESVWKNWLWRSEGDLMMNGAYFVPSGSPKASFPFSKADMISAKPGTYVTRLTRFSGALNCKIGKPC